MNAVNSSPASAIVNVIPSVVSGGGTALDLNGLLLDDGPRIPIGQVYSFASAAAVIAYYGATSTQAAFANVYFAGFSTGTKQPGALLIAQYPDTPRSPWIRGGSLANLTLAQLQALTGNAITVVINGTPHASTVINLASATSFSNAAQIISAAGLPTGPQTAAFTASIGASFTASASGTTLTVSALSGGIISAGDVVVGAGITGQPTIVTQLTGTVGGIGTYQLSSTQTAASESMTTNSTVLDVTAVASGTISPGNQLQGSGTTTNTFIGAQLSGTTGGIGTYSITVAQEVAAESMTAIIPTCTWDPLLSAFVITANTTGSTATLSVSGSLADQLLLSTKSGTAISSPGADVAVPATFMSGITAITEDWATFTTGFNPDASGNANKLAFAAWTNTTGNGYAYVAWDTDPTPTLSNSAPSSLGAEIAAAAYSGTVALYEPSQLHGAAFVCGFVASIDFAATNGRATLAFKGQSGLLPGVTSQTVASNLQANGYNYVGSYATRNDTFTFVYPGSISGPFLWVDSYINQIWLNNALQLALVSLLTTVKSIPYNSTGYALLEAACMDPINQALNFGAIRAGVSLSSAQAAEVNNAAGVAIDQVLSTRGWYLQIKDATSQVRAARGSPPMILWYMDGQSVQQVTLSSVEVQ